MSFAQTMRETASHLGLTSLAISDEGTCRIVFNDNQAIDIEESKEMAGALHVYSAVAKVPTSNREKLFQFLLEANFLGRGTGSANLSLDMDTQEILLYQMVNFQLSEPRQIAELLKAFGELAIQWNYSLANTDIAA